MAAVPRKKSINDTPLGMTGQRNMCLILFAHKYVPGYRLILCANRDEFYDRPARPLDWWPDAEDVLAGRDLKAGGTWMGISRSGRFAALTNYRDPSSSWTDAPSRGHLVSAYLTGNMRPKAFLEALSIEGHRYNGFNLLVGDPIGLWYFSNRRPEFQAIGSGLFGLSNAFLDDPWPKIARGKKRLADLLQDGIPETDRLFAMMRDQTIAPDADLPTTGVGLEWERILSAMCIVSPGYGTRCISVLFITMDHRVRFCERTVSVNPEGVILEPVRSFEFQIRT